MIFHKLGMTLICHFFCIFFVVRTIRGDVPTEIAVTIQATELEDGSYSLTCTCSSETCTEYKWFKNRRQFSVTVVRQLTVVPKNAQESVYHCLAYDASHEEWLTSATISIGRPQTGKTPEQGLENACNLPKQAGPCTGFFTNYFFNKTTQQCETFVFGGCNGNANRFETKNECEEKCLNTNNHRQTRQTTTNQTCGVNAVYKRCGYCDNECNQTHIAQGLAYCQPVACKPGCFCKTGFFRHPQSGQCVLAQNCPEETQRSTVRPCKDRHEEWKVCGHCDATCDHVNKTANCPAFCRSACFCKQGYYRDNDGKCVTEGECGITQCSEQNAEWRSCGGHSCRVTCKDIVNNKPCYGYEYCQPGCYCKEGYFKNDSNVCVPRRECPDNETPICRQIIRQGDTCSSNSTANSTTTNSTTTPSIRYGFNFRTKVCEPFQYTGCGGNKNNFATQSDCYFACNNLCEDGNKPQKCSRDVNATACSNWSCPRFNRSEIICQVDPCNECRARLYHRHSLVEINGDACEDNTGDACDDIECGRCRRCYSTSGSYSCVRDLEYKYCWDPCDNDPCTPCEQCVNLDQFCMIHSVNCTRYRCDPISNCGAATTNSSASSARARLRRMSEYARLTRLSGIRKTRELTTVD